MKRVRSRCFAAHPRSRGENSEKTAGGAGNRGSSPLTRGKRAWRRTQRPPTRLIPAHAGKTLPWQSHQGRIPAHPRSRGENTCSIWRLHKCTGSSPLTRGKLFDPAIPDAVARLIPAHAGKTHHQHHVACHAPAHPRSRGENSPRYSGAAPAAGSSPLTRGKQNTMTTYRRKGRLIPAHAGKTNKYGARLSRTTAHPRSRGENPGSGMPSWFRSGSSPLTRGKRRQLNPMRAASRLIPAHAGKTAEKPQRLFGASAHPRSRGENSARAISPGVNVGSSPLTRGKLPGMFHLIAVAGLIPAHAGKTPQD